MVEFEFTKFVWHNFIPLNNLYHAAKLRGVNRVKRIFFKKI